MPTGVTVQTWRLQDLYRNVVRSMQVEKVILKAIEDLAWCVSADGDGGIGVGRKGITGRTIRWVLPVSRCVDDINEGSPILSGVMRRFGADDCT